MCQGKSSRSPEDELREVRSHLFNCWSLPVKRCTIMKRLLVFLFLVTINVAAYADMNTDKGGYWSLGTDRAWSEADLDKAFSVFIRLKETYGDQFNLVVQDLHKEGTPRSDGTKTAQILIKVYVSPPNAVIDGELQSVGLVYVK